MAIKILLLPGLDGDGFYLGALHQTLALDYPCLQMSYPKQRMNYEDLCAWVVEQLDLESEYIIFAESFGGPLGIRVAEILENQAKALIFCATFCEPPLPRMLLTLAAALYPLLLPFRFLAHLLNFFIFNDTNLTAARQMHGILKAIPPAVITYRIRLLKTLDMRGASAALEPPSLVIAAKRDRLVWFGRFTHLSKPTFVTIDGPHGLAGIKTSDVAKVVLDFIKTLP